LIEFHAGLIAYRDPGNVEDSGEDPSKIPGSFAPTSFLLSICTRMRLRTGLKKGERMTQNGSNRTAIVNGKWSIINVQLSMQPLCTCN
jgi:hypothetical protein